jgi:MscS family membrane protein
LKSNLPGQPRQAVFLCGGSYSFRRSPEGGVVPAAGGLSFGLVRKLGAGMGKEPFVRLVNAPLETVLVILITLIALDKLHFPQALNFDIYEISIRAIVQGVAIAAFISAIFWLLLRVVDFVAFLLQLRSGASGELKDNQVIVFFRDFVRVILIFIGILLILTYAFKFEIRNFWTGLGIAGAALALATKESIENLIDSVIIFFGKPFTAGDIVKLDRISGTVEKVGLRSTRIRMEMKTYVTVPNKQMVDSVMDSQRLRTHRKAELRLQIGLSSPVDEIRDLLEGIRKILNKEVIENPSVFLPDIAPNAFAISVDYFTAPISLRNFNSIKQATNIEILTLMEKLGIELAGASTAVNIRTSAGEPG